MKGKVGWAEAIQKAFSQEADEIPPGWQTLEQIAAELKKKQISRLPGAEPAGETGQGGDQEVPHLDQAQ